MKNKLKTYLTIALLLSVSARSSATINQYISTNNVETSATAHVLQKKTNSDLFAMEDDQTTYFDDREDDKEETYSEAYTNDEEESEVDYYATTDDSDDDSDDDYDDYDDELQPTWYSDTIK